MQKTMMGLLTLGAVLLFAGLAAGCGSSSSSSSGTTAESTTTESSTSGNSSGEEVSAYFLLPSLENQSATRSKKGAEEEAEKMGVDLTVDAGSAQSASAEELVSKLENALLKNPDALIVNSGPYPEQLRQVLEGAIANGTKVVTVDVEIPDLSGVSTYVGLDDMQASAAAGEYLNEHFPKGGEVGIVSCYAENPVTIARTKGFESGLDEGKMKVVALVDPKCDPEKSRSMTENMLTAHPDLAAIYATTDIGAIGALKAAEAAGKEIAIIGHDGELPAMEAIEEGKMAGTVWNPFEAYGEEAIKAAVKAVEGGALPPKTLLESVLITKENVGEYIGASE